MDREVLRTWASSSDRIIAADAGADSLREIGVTPDIIVGDMDSISAEVLDSAKHRVHISEQDTTDCDKLLAHVEKDGDRAITLIGVEGDLPDHVLAILHSAARSPLRVRLAYRRGIGWIVKPGQQLVVQTQPGRRVSLIAIDPCKDVHLTGVKWQLNRAALSLNEGASISNLTVDGEISVSIGQGAALLFVEVPAAELPLWDA